MIILENISFSYPNKEIFQNSNLDVNSGEFLFVVGESGIGKTTLLRLIYFDLFPKTGTVKFENYNSKTLDKTDIPVLRREIGIVFQDFKLFFDRNVYENLAVPLYLSGDKSEDIKKKVFNIASRFKLLDVLKKMPYDLSGGEQQKVCIARAMVNEPKLFIADEPTGNLDPFISYELFKYIDEINAKGTTVIVATHNFEIVRKFPGKRIIQIKSNKFFDVKLKI
jgi:cell division transport system ATP-binding protein